VRSIFEDPPHMYAGRRTASLGVSDLFAECVAEWEKTNV
jgi:hypothetical protein